MDDVERMEYERLQTRLRFDLLNIDDALVNHPQEMFTACELMAKSGYQRDTAKEIYERTMADRAMRLREQTPNISEARIKAELPIYQEIVDAKNTVLQTEYEYNQWSALVNALRSKDRALQTSGDLVKAGYLSRDTIRQDEWQRARTYAPIKRRTP